MSNSISSKTHFVSSAGYNSGLSSRADKFIERYADRFNVQLDKDWSVRESRLNILQMFLDSSIYDNLLPFYQEYQGSNNNGKYNPIVTRRPSIIYNMAKLIVDESVSMLFGEGHFPNASCDHEETTEFLQYLNKKCNLRKVMLNAAKIGSIGSVCIVIKILNRKFYFDVLCTKNLMPVYQQEDPEQLASLHERKKILGDTLMSLGYEIRDEDRNKWFFIEREWNLTQEIYYEPYLVENADKHEIQIDKDRSYEHGLGFVPAVWIQNTPKAHHIDGDCTFEQIIDIMIEISYVLSQQGRGIKFNSDPTLVVKNPTSLEGAQLIKGSGILSLDEKGDAYYAEISGNSITSTLEYVEKLRAYGLEVIRANRANPDKIKANLSGKGLQMLNSPLLGLVDEMRLSYGEYGLINIYCMCIDMYLHGEYDIDYEGKPPYSSDCKDHMSLDWPDWYPATGQDKFQEAQAINTYVASGLMSKETAIRSIQDEYNIHSIEDEMQTINNENEQKMQDDVEKADQLAKVAVDNAQKPKSNKVAKPEK